MIYMLRLPQEYVHAHVRRCCLGMYECEKATNDCVCAFVCCVCVCVFLYFCMCARMYMRVFVCKYECAHEYEHVCTLHVADI